MSLSSLALQVRMGKHSPAQEGKLEKLISQYPDVLNEELSYSPYGI